MIKSEIDHYEYADPVRMVDDVLKAMRPPPDISVATWSEKYRRLSPESSAFPGRLSLDKTPYMREPLEMVGRPGVRSIAMMCSAQVAKSTFIENVIGYFADLDPCPILHISPTLDSAKMFSKERLAPMIRDTSRLKGLFREARTRDSSNTMLSKKFPGGHLAMVGSNSPAGLASRPVRVLVADEVDRFERSAGTEGDPLRLGVKRTTTYWNRILVYVSTPGEKYNPAEQTGSRIEKEFLDGDQRHYHIKCPHCDHYQVPKWSQVQWEDNNPLSAIYVCEESGCVMTDSDRHVAILNGKWVASEPFNGNVSYHLSQLSSMLATLSDAVSEFLSARKDPMLLKTWVNTVLGEPWEDKGQRLEWSGLKDQREDYDADKELPEEIIVVTSAVDVQGDYLEYEFVGWGLENRSWSLLYGSIYGDLSTRHPWDELDTILKRTFKHPVFGEMTSRANLIDSGGSYTESVYRFCQDRPRTVAIKGVPGQGRPFIGRPMKNTIKGARVFPVGVDSIKETVVSRLRVTDSTAPGYCAFPLTYDDEYFKMLTAEELKTTYRKGKRVQAWIPIRRRNEAFDCRVYNTAALEMLSVNLASEYQRLLREAESRDNRNIALTKKPARSRRKPSWSESWKHD